MRGSEGNILHYNLTDYAQNGKRSTRWIVDGAEKYHRTFSEIINALVEASVTIEKMLETIPTKETIKHDKSWETDLYKPNFLLIKVLKCKEL